MIIHPDVILIHPDETILYHRTIYFLLHKALTGRRNFALWPGASESRADFQTFAPLDPNVILTCGKKIKITVRDVQDTVGNYPPRPYNNFGHVTVNKYCMYTKYTIRGPHFVRFVLQPAVFDIKSCLNWWKICLH